MGLPPQIPNNQRIFRALSNYSWFNAKKQIVKPNAFRLRPDEDTLSLGLTAEAAESDLTGDVHGFGTMLTDAVHGLPYGLAVREEDPPRPGRVQLHGIPRADQARAMAIATALADAAQLILKPTQEQEE